VILVDVEMHTPMAIGTSSGLHKDTMIKRMPCRRGNPVAITTVRMVVQTNQEIETETGVEKETEAEMVQLKEAGRHQASMKVTRLLPT
jgi:hypothetical protein